MHSIVAAAFAACLPTSSIAAVAAADAPAAARALARDAVIVDGHIDAPTELMKRWVDLGVEQPTREFDYPKAVDGGLDVAFMSIYTSSGQDEDGSAWNVANRMIDAVDSLAMRHPDKFALLRSPHDVEQLRKPLRKDGAPRVLLPLGMENGAPIGDDLSRLAFFFDRGVRYITLAHSANNRIADSSYAVEKRWNGLSPFGERVVDEMNRLGIMVDVSHLSDAAVAAAVARSRAPVVATHSALRHFTPGFERNLSDELAKAIAAKGGVIQIPFGNAFVDPASAAQTQAYFTTYNAFLHDNAAAQAAGRPTRSVIEFDDEWDKNHPPLPVRIDAVLDQIDYGVKLVGIDHIGLGSDFDGVSGALPEGLKTVADFPHLVAGLQSRGYSDADIRKILGENLLRMWREVEAVSDRRR
ncbi:MAG: membrane dipeptidase [Lysobacteraceae bacterium]|nr:MAG: membrane dipeptidase [Xanthomonadaceae bacterium]